MPRDGNAMKDSRSMKHDSAQAMEATRDAHASDDTWFVKTASGVQTWTLDQLDLAFQRGEVDASTPVLTSGMTGWETLGVIADLADMDAPAANDTEAPSSVTANSAGSRGFSARSGPPPRRSKLPPPPPLDAPTPRTTRAEGGSFPPTSAAVLGSGAATWASIATPDPELQTVVRRKAGVVPFAVRRGLGRLLDGSARFTSQMRAAHPRWAAVGPWLFGAALSGIFVTSLYQLANAPMRSGSHAQGGPVLEQATASAQPAAGSGSVAASARASSLAELRAAQSPAPAAEPLPVARSVSTDGAATPAALGEGAALRARDLRLAPSRAEQQATSGRAKAKAKAWSKRSSRARAARKARRTQRVSSWSE